MFYGSQKEYARQKVARVNGHGKEKGKGQQRNLQRQSLKKKSKFLRIRMHQIRIFYIFLPNLEENDQVKKKVFFKAKLASWQPKN